MELGKISEWFKTNKLLLNIKKTNYTLFHKNSTKDDLPLKLPDLKIVNSVLKMQTSIKFLGIMLDENISWKEHIKTVENKLSKNIGLLCKSKQLLDNESLKSIYFSYIHSYLNYANIALASANPTKFKKINYLQKQAARIIFNEDRLCHSRPLLKNLNALNVYQINLYQNLNFMHRIKMGNIPEVFHETIKKPNHKYPTTFSNLNYSIKKYSLKSTKYSVSYRGPTLWNTILDKRDKEIKSHLLFKKKIKSKLLDITNEQMFF